MKANFYKLLLSSSLFFGGCASIITNPTNISDCQHNYRSCRSNSSFNCLFKEGIDLTLCRKGEAETCLSERAFCLKEVDGQRRHQREDQGFFSNRFHEEPRLKKSNGYNSSNEDNAITETAVASSSLPHTDNEENKENGISFFDSNGKFSSQKSKASTVQVTHSKKGRIIAVAPEDMPLDKNAESKYILIKKNPSNPSREISDEDNIFEGRIKRVSGKKMLIIFSKDTFLPIGEYLICASKSSC